MGQTLTAEKAAWLQRQTSGALGTVAEDIGGLGRQTEASAHAHDAKDADHTPEAEFIAFMRAHERELLSLALTQEKLAWQQRQAATKAAEMKRFEVLDADGSG